MRKILSLVLALAMLLTLAAVASADDVVTIKLMMSNTQQTGVSAAVEAFNKAYEGKYVCEAEYLAFDNVFETIEVSMQQDTAEFDVFAADGPNIGAYVNRGYLTPLNDYITAEEFASFTPAMQDEVTVGDAIYGAAMGDSELVMYYNTALLEQAGIDPAELFAGVDGEHRISWEKLVETAKAAQAAVDPDGSQGIIGIEFQQVGRTYQMNVLANDRGGANIAEGGLSVDGVINSTPWIEALTWYQQQVNDGVFSKGIAAGDTSSYFMAGKIIFYLGTTALPGTFDNNGFTTYGYTYKPFFEGHEADVTTCCGSWAVGMNPKTEKAQAAAEFIKYLCIYDGSDVYINASGMLPALSRQFTDELIAAKPYLAIAQYEGANTALVRAKTPAFNEYSTSVNALWENVRNGADPAQAAQDCVDELTTAFLEYED